MNKNLKNKIFPVILQEDETGGYVVTNPSLDGCYSQGETVEEALKNIKEATELCLLDDVKSKSKKIKTPNISLHFINLQNNYA
ncbi:MAG: type II toxin-antitoxin system HicB family antitoxin [Patescibacteria group bacterium]